MTGRDGLVLVEEWMRDTEKRELPYFAKVAGEEIVHCELEFRVGRWMLLSFELKISYR